MTPPQPPRTEAGRELLARESLNSRSFPLITPDAILAIETEAAGAALAELAEIRERDAEDERWRGAPATGEK